MQKICALIVWLLVGFAVVVAPGGVGPAHSEKQNKDQDKTNKKKSEAGEVAKLSDKHSTSDIKKYCSMVGGVYSTVTSYSGPNGGYVRSGTGYMCQSGCGTGGCTNVIACDMDENCYKRTGPRIPSACKGNKRSCDNYDYARADDPESILGSGPSLSVNGPSRTGTPKPAPPAPPPAPMPNPG